MLAGEADMAVHSLKDLPTELPTGLVLGATPKRENVRDVLIYRSTESALGGFKPHMKVSDFPQGATIATSSTRRKAQLLAARPDLNVIEIRGNVATRMQKVADQQPMHATVLALAGMTRLNFTISPDGKIHGDAVPAGLLATVLDLDLMLPCVGQGAIGIEVRAGDERLAAVCKALNDYNTFQAVTAERAFLSGMGGGCQSPVAAYAEISGDTVSMRAISFANGPTRRAEGKRPIIEAAELGQQLAVELT
jgi:hydroxymethylbilane synthase